MILKAIIPPGQTEITVNGLHQWNYGCMLEIYSNELPEGLVEVHFACADMESAVVRSCSTYGGVVEAAIPDQCLEQTSPIVAWVYALGETTGTTIKTIRLPIIPRTRPQSGSSIPETVSDKYTEAVAAMNQLVGQVENTVTHAKDEVYAEIAKEIQNGTLIVGEASHAARADHAYTANDADYAAEAYTSQNAALAERATKADSATNDDAGNPIASTYLKKSNAPTVRNYRTAQVINMSTFDSPFVIGDVPDGKIETDISAVSFTIENPETGQTHRFQGIADDIILKTDSGGNLYFAIKCNMTVLQYHSGCIVASATACFHTVGTSLYMRIESGDGFEIYQGEYSDQLPASRIYFGTVKTVAVYFN